MALKDLIEVTETPSDNLLSIIGNAAKGKKIGLSEERFLPIENVVRDYIAYWREYPDMFIDFLQDGGNPEIKKELKFYSYQRVKK